MRQGTGRIDRSLPSQVHWVWNTVRVFWLPLRPNLRAFPEYDSSGTVADFVSGYRCGAAPAFHRFPRRSPRPEIFWQSSTNNEGEDRDSQAPAGCSGNHPRVRGGWEYAESLPLRLPKEWMALGIGTILNLPLNHLAELSSKLDPAEPVVPVCNSAYRSGMATGILERKGFKKTRNLEGSSKAWMAAGLPVYKVEKTAAAGLVPVKATPRGLSTDTSKDRTGSAPLTRDADVTSALHGTDLVDSLDHGDGTGVNQVPTLRRWTALCQWLSAGGPSTTILRQALLDD